MSLHMTMAKNDVELVMEEERGLGSTTCHGGWAVRLTPVPALSTAWSCSNLSQGAGDLQINLRLPLPACGSWKSTASPSALPHCGFC